MSALRGVIVHPTGNNNDIFENLLLNKCRALNADKLFQLFHTQTTLLSD